MIGKRYQLADLLSAGEAKRPSRSASISPPVFFGWGGSGVGGKKGMKVLLAGTAAQTMVDVPLGFAPVLLSQG